MAIYHLHARIHSRSKGRSILAAAAYRAATKLYDHRLGQSFDYGRKSGVDYAAILAPETIGALPCPAWVKDREQLWNAVEAKEKRKDAQLAREVQLALPKELSDGAQVALVESFVKEQFVAQGMVADVTIHRDNPDNPHAHILLTQRPLELGEDDPAVVVFGKKDRSWNAKDKLMAWRSEWALAANRSLELEGVAARIDHRSYREQGLALEATNKIGSDKKRAERDGRDIIQERLARHDDIVRRNGEAIAQNPLVAIQAISYQHATFTRRDVARWLHTRTVDAEQFQHCLDRVLASPELVALESRRKGDMRYTTRENLAREQRMLDLAGAMAERTGHAVSEKYLRQAERGRSLSKEQRAAMHHIAGPEGVAVVEGHAGAGKSYMFGAAREAWEAQGYRVLGAALAGKAAEGLELAAKIRSRSLHAWQYAWRNGREELRRKDVLVIDEAGMVGSRQMQEVVAYAHRAGAKVVLVGDARQLQAIEAGAPFRAIRDQLVARAQELAQAGRHDRPGAVKLQDIRRQEVSWQREAVQNLAAGRVELALKAFSRRGCVHRHVEHEDALRSVVSAWARGRRGDAGERRLSSARGGSSIMLAFRRKDVRALNDQARALRKAAGELGRDHRIETAQGARSFARGDRLYFLKNDRGLDVKNGSLATIEKISGTRLQVRLDDGTRRVFDAKDYNHIDHGYAATVHKSQGVTVDGAYVLASSYFDQHVAYVALSRQRHHVELHWSKEEFSTKQAMVQALSRARPKDMAIDYDEVERANVKLEEDLARQPPSAPAPAKEDPYAMMEPRELRQLARNLRRMAEREPMTPKQAMEGLEEVRKAMKAAEIARSTYKATKNAYEVWAKKHPVHVRLGTGGAQKKKAQLAKAKERVRDTRAVFEELWGDEGLQKRAQKIAADDIRYTQVAKEQLQRMEPALERTAKELSQHRGKERGRDLGKDRGGGFDR